MEPQYVSALAALAGSVVGGFTSFATTYFSQRTQSRLNRLAREVAKREALYGKFIDEASKVLADAIRNEFDDPTALVPLGAIMNRMRLFASPDVLAAAERVFATAMEISFAEHRALRDYSQDMLRSRMEPLITFGETCRRELDQIA
jgi:hypothetical protein